MNNITKVQDRIVQLVDWFLSKSNECTLNDQKIDYRKIWSIEHYWVVNRYWVETDINNHFKSREDERSLILQISVSETNETI